MRQRKQAGKVTEDRAGSHDTETVQAQRCREASRLDRVP